jgi:hypothetical protein
MAMLTARTPRAALARGPRRTTVARPRCATLVNAAATQSVSGRMAELKAAGKCVAVIGS